MSRMPNAVQLAAWSLTAALASGAAAQDDGPPTVRIEQELRVTIDPKPTPNTQCEAATATSYHQRNALARLESTITVNACAAASGKFTVTVRVRDERGEVRTLEFPETWQRSDGRELSFVADYPIGENVELVSVRVRGMTCTCADAPASAAESPQAP